MKARVLAIAAIAIVLAAASAAVYADVPSRISYQGRLTNDLGQPVDSVTNITFVLYEDSLGTAQLWEETHPSVKITNGLFTVLLGSINPNLMAQFEGKERWLGIKIGDGAVMMQALPIVSSTYAFKSQRTDSAAVAKAVVDNAITSAKILNGTIQLVDLGQNGAAAGEVIKWTGSAWDAGADEIGSNVSGWTDGGDVVGLTSVADTVAINTSTRLGKLNVGGNIGIYPSGYIYFGNDTTYVRGLSGNLHLECNGVYFNTRGNVFIGHPVDGNWVKFDNTNKRVGIGTMSVDDKLHIENTTAGGACWFKIQNSDATTWGQTGLRIQTPANTWHLRQDLYSAANFAEGALSLYSTGGSVEAMTWLENGNVGIGMTTPGNHRLYVKGASSTYSGSTIYAENTSTNGTAAYCYVNSSYPALVAAQKGTGDIFRCVWIDAGDASTAVFRVTDEGRAICPELELTGGSDVAEPFEISGTDAIPPGALVVIDEDNPGRLKLASSPYDARVAGVVSGAGGIKPGITLSQKGVNAGGQNVAISGRVYCLADAGFGAIKPGDLLTTSPTAGHAMIASDRSRAYGAVIGKAMSALDSGTGVVLLLVSLQ